MNSKRTQRNIRFFTKEVIISLGFFQKKKKSVKDSIDLGYVDYSKIDLHNSWSERKKREGKKYNYILRHIKKFKLI